MWIDSRSIWSVLWADGWMDVGGAGLEQKGRFWHFPEIGHKGRGAGLVVGMRVSYFARALVGKCLCTLEGFASSRGNERRKELPSLPPVLPIFKSKRVPAGAGGFLSFLEINMCVSEHCLI